MAYALRDSRPLGAADTNTTTVAVTLQNVASGDLIVVGFKYEGGAATTVTVSDGTSSLTVLSQTSHSNNDQHTGFAYLLSSVATGTVTYTATLTDARTWKRIGAMAFNPNGATTTYLDTTGTYGTSTSANSGNISLSSTNGVALGWYSSYSNGTTSAFQIGGTASDGSETDGTAYGPTIDYRLFSSALGTVAATNTIGASNEWTKHIIAFGEAGGAPASITKQAAAYYRMMRNR